MLKVINEQYEEDNDGISSDTDFLLDDDNFLDICADEAIFRRLIKCTEESKKNSTYTWTVAYIKRYDECNYHIVSQLWHI